MARTAETGTRAGTRTGRWAGARTGARAGGRPGPHNPLALAAAQIGDRWSLLIVDALTAGPQRFNDLQEAIDGIASNVLAKRLEHLERHAVLVARAYSDRPPRYAYELTGSGHELVDVLRLLRTWGGMRQGTWSTDHGSPGDEVLAVHPPCGSALEMRWWCPACAEPVVPVAGTTDVAGGEEIRYL